MNTNPNRTIRKLTVADVDGYLDVYLNAYPAYKDLDDECREKYRKKATLEITQNKEVIHMGMLAEQAYHDYDLRAFENPAWMYAGARHALELRARRTEFLGVFEPALLLFARWLAGNTARRSCRGGYGVLPVPAELPGSLDAMDAMLAGSRSAFDQYF